MGLDVYLYKYSDFKKSKEVEKEYEKYSEMLYDTIDGIDDEDVVRQAREDIRKKLNEKAKELGLGSYGQDETYKTCIELDSVLHPEHIFKIGYFRSSYNSGGINIVLQDLNIPTLYDIFEHESDEYEFQPNWKEALKVVRKAISLLKEDKGYRVETVSANMFRTDEIVKTAAEALDIFKTELDGEINKPFNSYSNINGQFYLDNSGLKVHALIPGKNIFNTPCTYVIYKTEEQDNFYLEALEIVQETIEYVLDQDNPQDYYLSWSA